MKIKLSLHILRSYIPLLYIRSIYRIRSVDRIRSLQRLTFEKVKVKRSCQLVNCCLFFVDDNKTPEAIA